MTGTLSGLRLSAIARSDSPRGALALYSTDNRLPDDGRVAKPDTARLTHQPRLHR
jgi:hypothetical protein